MPPAGIGRALWYDLSPMRPDEHGRQRADRWYRAEAIQRAYRTGQADAEREHRRKEARKKQEGERIARLKAKVGG